jgi:dihydroorotate dehydrogenase
LLVKIAPDLADEDLDAVADLAVDQGLQGIIACNTTTSREGLATPPPVVERLGEGGLSGAPLRRRAIEVLHRLATRVGSELTLIAAGGIETPDDAAQRIAAGATLVQAYTAFIYRGPRWPARMNRALASAHHRSSMSS